MSMKYRLLLCVVVLLACTATLFAGTVTIYKQTFDPANVASSVKDTDPLKYSKWTFGGNWAVIPNVATKPGIPASISPNGTNGLVYQKNGDYETNIDPAAYVTTLPIDCTGKTSVQLSFLRSLTIEDRAFDTASVDVSNNGTAWNNVYLNPTAGKSKATDNTQNLTDATWVAVSYDISGTADNQKTVFLRWGIKSNNGNTNGGSTTIPNLHGWAIQDITLSAAGGDAFYAPAQSGAVIGGGFLATGPIWEKGAPAVGTSGQTRLKDPSDPSLGNVTLGRDPGAVPAGSPSTSIFGTLLGQNYPAGMNASFADSIVPADAVRVAPQYLVWGPLDFTGLQGTTLAFQNWTNLGAGNLNKASIQIHVATPDGDTPDAAVTIKDDTTSNKINIGTPKVTYAVSTAKYWAQQDGLANNALKVTFKYNTSNIAAGEKLTLRYTLDNSAGTVVWVPFVRGTITTNTGTSSDNTVKIVMDSADFQSKADYIKAQDNKNFAVSAILTQTDGTALASGSTAAATISEAKVEGVLWDYLFDLSTDPVTATTEFLSDLGDGKAAWTAWPGKWGNLSGKGADDSEAVWVRWSIGPTYFNAGFSTNYGGWNIADPQIVEASRQWAATPKETIPTAMTWETTGAFTVPAKNTGTATWDDSFTLFEAKGVTSTTTNLGDPIGPASSVKVVSVASPPSPISRWSVDSVDVAGTVAPDTTYQFKGTLTAPPLSSVVYATPVKATSAADADLSRLDADWDMANATALGDEDWLPTYRGTSIANGAVETSKFLDDRLDTPVATSGNWARFWTEELAGRVPMVVQGFGDGSYRPTVAVTRDQIAVYMARAIPLALNPAGETGTVFSDIQPGYWTNGAIEACQAAGIVAGFPDRTYQPTNVVKRDAMAKYIVNSYNVMAAASAGAIAPWAIADKTATSADDQKAQVAAGWFPDVPIWNDPANPLTGDAAGTYGLRNFINTLVLHKVVTGYAQPDPNDSSKTIFTYRPLNTIDRASLAVYVWRAFMLTNASAVVLGGPAITDVQIATDGAAPAVASYYGYSNAGASFTSGPFKDDASTKGPFAVAYKTRIVNAGDQNYAYVTFDAVRLAGADPLAGLDVKFELKRVTGTTGPVIPVLSNEQVLNPTALGQWISDVTSATANGEPYRNVVWAIPTGLQGDFQLVTTINDVVLGRTVNFSVRNGIYTYNFDAGAPPSDWQLFGQPTSPGPKAYPTDYIAADSSFKPNTDLFKGVASVELTGTQQIVRRFDTTGRHNLRLGIRFAQAGFGSTDAIKIEWSKDYGSKGPSATWTQIASLAGTTAVPSKLQKDPVYYALPNGSPNTDPVVIGADNNVDFAIRLSVNVGTSTTKKAYFDTLSIDGT